MKKQLLLSLLALFLGTFLMNAQQVSCGSVFTDPDGPNANYVNNANVTTTICPTNPTDYVTVNFSAFSLENNYDFLKVYDGSTSSATLIATLTGTSIPSAISSSVPGGCLTFVFTSDSSVGREGWIADVTCSSVILPTCSAPTNLVLTTNSGSSLPILTWNSATSTQWEVIEMPAGTVPTATSTGVIVSNNSYQVIGSPSSNSTVVYVRAICDTNLVSGWAPSVTIATPLCPTPTSLTVTNATSSSANLNWVTTSNATSWQVAVQLNSVTTVPTTGVAINGTPTYNASGLLPGTAYKFYVRTDCGNGVYGSWSSAYSFTTQGIALTTPACGGLFTDNGGLNANYNNNTDSTVTIYPVAPGDVVTVTFTAFDTESSWDGLYVYNGNSTSAPQIASTNPAGNVPGGLAGAFWGTTIPGPFTSSSPDGSLTFRFRSDTSVNKAGWSANVTCGPPPTCPAPIQLVVSGTTLTSTSINWLETGAATQWEVIVLPATATAPTATATGTIVNSVSTYLASNLTMGTAYKAYIRSVCSSSDMSAWTSVAFSTLSCVVTASNFAAYNVTSSAANIYYSNPNGATVQVVVVPAGTAAPTSVTTGVTLTPNGYLATGLNCATTYIVYANASCNSSTPTAWSQVLTFTTTTCVITTGHASNLIQCDESGQVCFNLTDNDAPILNGLNPSDYSISYYSSAANAAAQTLPLSSPYCVSTGTYTIYAVLKNNVTLEKQTLTFTITAQSVLSTTVVTNLEQCDDDQDGNVVFNLTTQVTSNNPLSYYLSLANATSQANPITNLTAYSISSVSPSVTIFVRESIANACDAIYSFELHAYSDCNLAHNCSQANSLCGSLGVPFANTHQGIHAEPGNAYGCLGSTPNPTWFYLPVSNAGTINLTVEQNTAIDFAGNVLDVDYIVYGPFSDPVTPCSTHFTQNNIVSCSYSASGIEHPVIANGQVGQYYLLMTTNFSNQAGYIRITMDATSQGAIDCSGMRLNAFLDSNNNGTQEVGESNFPLGQFHYDVNSGSVHNITSSTGVYNIYDTNGANTYNINYTLDPSYASMYAITTSSYSNLHIVNGGGMITYNFPVTSLQNYDDLAVAIVPLTAPRAGFTYKNKIVYTNLGSQTIAAGTVSFTANSGTTITAISQSGTTSAANGFTYNFTDLLPFETRTITVTMMVPPIPAVLIGQLLTNSASINPTLGDIVLGNNTNASTQAVIASYDPNDKVESHGSEIVYSSFTTNDYLYYTIRFENTGTASAIDVSVNDILDTKLDETSIKMVSASHGYTLDRVGNNLTWKFDNIQLPVSVADTEIGKGYVTFKVKMKPGFSVGDVVPNTASIYFDSNPAIITNTFNTQFVSLLANASFATSEFLLYPNPASQMVQITMPNTSDSLESITLYDVVGKVVRQINSISANQSTIDVSQMEKGVYFVEILTENNTKQIKKLVVK